MTNSELTVGRDVNCPSVHILEFLREYPHLWDNYRQMQEYNYENN